MKAFKEFEGEDPAFWAFIKYISQALGYSKRGENVVKTYTPEQILQECNKTGTTVDEKTLEKAVAYIEMRADLLNNYVKKQLMDVDSANEEFLKWKQLHRAHNYSCKLPMNKQKGEMHNVAFFTAIINILAEKTIREQLKVNTGPGFDDDPGKSAFVRDNDGHIIGVSSRRFDGAFPGVQNPRLVWEIKEYYYNKTFGSRVADGVYETQLDGFEFKEIQDRTGAKVYHVLFIDSLYAWWEKGKSYLCRLVDALNSGVVDEVIVGREVLTRWPELLEEIIHS